MNNRVLAIAGLTLLAVASPPLVTPAESGYRGYYGGYYRSYNARAYYMPRLYRSYAYRSYNHGMPYWYNKRFHSWRPGANTN